MLAAGDIREFLAAHRAAVAIELVTVKGSSPRDAGALMLAAPQASIGTIGGGQLEHLALQRARQMLRDGVLADSLDVPLGPEIGQCCGGRVVVSLNAVDGPRARELARAAEREIASRPNVYVFGAGHVGRALCRALALLPLHVHAVDTRAEELEGLPHDVEPIASPMPEAVVRSAPPGSAYVILTHDHALDFLIGFEALARTDAPYVGMVGSKTKRARFRGWYLAEGGEPTALDRLVLPIGGATFPDGLGDKRPEVIAALAAAELLVHLGQGQRAALGSAGVASEG